MGFSTRITFTPASIDARKSAIWHSSGVDMSIHRGVGIQLFRYFSTVHCTWVIIHSRSPLIGKISSDVVDTPNCTKWARWLPPWFGFPPISLRPHTTIISELGAFIFFCIITTINYSFFVFVNSPCIIISIHSRFFLTGLFIISKYSQDFIMVS